MVGARAGWLVACLLLPGPALAQVPITLTYDQVLLAPVQPDTDALASEAKRVDGLLATAIGAANELVDMAAIPAFEPQGYDAKTYLAACPPGQYAGCLLVLGLRAEADWAIGGTLEPADLGGGESQLTVHVVDVKGSREVMAFGVVVGGGTDDNAVVRGVAGVFDSVVGGLADEIDLRANDADPAAQEAFERRRQQLIAASLEQLESQLGEVIREDVAIGRLEAPKVTLKDMAEFSGRDDAAPWERLGMSKFQYVRYQNSGVPITEWRRRIRGRLGQILARVSFGAGGGPWGVHHEGRWLVAFDDASQSFVNAEVWQYQEARQALASQLQLELAFGVLPWVELSGVFGLRNAPYTYRFDQDSAADPVSIVGPPSRATGSQSEFGGRIEFIPMPTFPVRPTVHAGVFAWSGSGISPADDPTLVPLDAPKGTYIEIGPGVELSAGRYLNLFARGHADVFVGGTFIDEVHTGIPGLLQDFEGPVGAYGNGWGIAAGFEVRIGLLGDPSDRPLVGSGGDDEEPDL